MTTQPHDDFAERALVGEILRTTRVPDDVRELVRPDDFHSPFLRAVAEACWDATQPCDPVTIRAELLRRGHRPPSNAVDAVWLLDLMASAMPGATHYARTIRDLAVRRQVINAAVRAQQQAENPSEDGYDVAASLAVTAATLAERSDPAAPSSAVDLADFCAGSLDYDWLVPGLLERGDRVLLTGGEGSGKSVMTRQLAVSIAAGSHPFTGRHIEPRKVLIVDLENGERTLRRHLIALRKHADTIGRPVPMRGLLVESVPAGVDLTRAAGEAWLTRLCEDVQPEVLVIGPLYRMHAANMNDEEPARQLTRVIDQVRSRHHCVIVMETHAPHANGTTGKRSLRPVGSSLFMRWPEFGYGIAPSDKGNDVVAFEAWRGPRDEREWPHYLRRGAVGREWPWVQHNAGFRSAWEDEESA